MKSKFVYFSLLFGLFILACKGNVTSNTDISGEGSFIEGESFVINGSGFGDLDLNSILLWDEIEAGDVGTDLPESPFIGSWTLKNWSGFNPQYSDTKSHSGLKSSHASSYNGGFRCQFSRKIPHDKKRFYWSFWYIYHYEGNDGQTKLFQLWGTLPHDNDYNPGVMSGGAVESWWSSYIALESGGSNNQDWYTGAPSMDEWHHLEAILEQSDPGVANGNVIIKNDGVDVYKQTNVITRETADQYWDEAHYFYGFTNFGAGNFVENYIDDPYFASTWARVEIGNNSNYEDANHRELLVPTSWTDTEIIVNARRGSFDIGDNVYLFVISEDNVPNDGIEITISDK